MDSSSLKFWESVENWGFVAVLIGVAGESIDLVEKWLAKRNKQKAFARLFEYVLHFETAFWALVCFGLALEFIGGSRSRIISDADNARLNNEAAEFRLKYEQLKEVTDWREITSSESHSLSEVLTKNPSTVHITYVANDTESLMYAAQFSDAFGIGGWNVQIEAGSYGGVFWGVFLNGSDGADSRFVDTAREALDAAHISYSSNRVPPPVYSLSAPNLTKATVELTIGCKPRATKQSINTK